MPKDIENHIQTLIDTFVWGGDKAAVNLKQTRQHFNKGGFKLLNIHACNEAIEIIWLKNYLLLDKSRPLWAFVADILMEECIVSSK